MKDHEKGPFNWLTAKDKVVLLGNEGGRIFSVIPLIDRRGRSGTGGL